MPLDNDPLERHTEIRRNSLGRCCGQMLATVGVAIGVFSVLAASSSAAMQQSARMYRVGILTAAAGSLETLRQGLRGLGYVEGQNVVLEIRDTEGRPERASELALQLARLKVDVLVATHPTAVFA